MDTQLKNLFPKAVKKGAIEVFGEQSIQPVLLRLIPANTAAGQSNTFADISELLHPKERATLDTYRLAKRRTEYLTGRICAKKAVHYFLSETSTSPDSLLLPEIEITNTSIGRPQIHLPWPQSVSLKIDISISHSGDYGSALAAESKCGIDLQLQKNALLHVQEKYCTASEFNLLEKSLVNCDVLSRLTVLWAAKEAGKKALSYWQMPGFLDLQLCELTRYPGFLTVSLCISNRKNNHFPDQLTVVASMFENYALAICLVREENGNARTA